MKYVHYQSAISPHVIHLVQGCVDRLGKDEVRYVYESKGNPARVKLGWNYEGTEWTLNAKEHPEEAHRWLDECPCLTSGFRDFDLFERRVSKGLKTIYSSECWFRPIGIFWGRFHIPGWIRLLSPTYFKMVHRFVRLLKADNSFFYFPIGVHAVREAVWLLNLMSGHFFAAFRNQMPSVERKPYGKVVGCPKLRMTSYTVAISSLGPKEVVESGSDKKLRILWVGRLLFLKRVDVLIRAVKEIRKNYPCFDLLVKIVGTGPEEFRLKKMAQGLPIEFMEAVSMQEVRRLMREADVYVLTSNGVEGWGAVVNEALEEGTPVLGTYEAGSCATILPKDCLFHAGDYVALAQKLVAPLSYVSIGEWGADAVAKHFCEDVIGMDA